MARSIDAIREEMVHREAIRECICNIARASDRVDVDLWKECFWPEATDEHAGQFAGKAMGLLEHSIPFLDSLKGTTHFLGNSYIDIDGNFAKTETYVLGCHLTVEPEELNVIGTGRYLDRFERRGDEWRIINRNLVLDWFMNVPADEDWSRPHFDLYVDGQRKPDDFSCRFFGAGPKVETTLSSS